MSNIIEIHDFAAAELDVYARLNERQLLSGSEDTSLFIAESPMVIERALDAKCIPVSLLMEKKHVLGKGKGIIERCGNVPVYTAELDVLTQLTGFKLTRGMLCAMKRPELRTVGEVCNGVSRIAVLEGIMNPTNIGAIFRSAAALGIDAVLLTDTCSDPLYRRAIRVSMGTVFQIPWAFFESSMPWPESGLRYLKSLGFKSVAMALSEDSIDISSSVLAEERKLAIVLGTEGDGLARNTIADCDYTVRIPMSHGVDSLNVAAASAVAFFQLTKKRTYSMRFCG